MIYFYIHLMNFLQRTRVQNTHDLKKVPRNELGQYILYGEDLRGADLQNADLRGADLRWTHLEDALLQGVALQGADLCDAHLEVAIFNEDSHLEGANLQDAQLTWADLRGAHLEGANLQDADLKDAYLQCIHLQNANLEGAHLEMAHFDKFSQLEGANLKQAHLMWAYLQNVQLTNVDLQGADLYRANLTGANFTGSELTGVNFTGANLTGAKIPPRYIRLLSELQRTQIFREPWIPDRECENKVDMITQELILPGYGFALQEDVDIPDCSDNTEDVSQDIISLGLDNNGKPILARCYDVQTLEQMIDTSDISPNTRKVLEQATIDRILVYRYSDEKKHRENLKKHEENLENGNVCSQGLSVDLYPFG